MAQRGSFVRLEQAWRVEIATEYQKYVAILSEVLREIGKIPDSRLHLVSTIPCMKKKWTYRQASSVNLSPIRWAMTFHFSLDCRPIMHNRSLRSLDASHGPGILTEMTEDVGRN
jgi:hypothetical protein